MRSDRTPSPTRIPPALNSTPAGNLPAPAMHLASGVLDPTTLTSDASALQAELDKLANYADSLHAQLRQAQKLASLGATAAMIAHEFNNLFTPIVAYGRQALDTGDVELMRTALNKTLDQVAVMRNMSDRVIGLAKQSDTVIKSVNIREVATKALECLGRDLSKDNIAVNLQIDSALALRSNESLLLQVLFNLVINARQAMLGRRGRLAIDAAATADDTVEINVRDNGCGIPQENLSRIFDPFFSTKQHADRPDGRGLGLGLSICLDIVQELGGTLEVASQPGAGTTFTLTLPQNE